MYSLLLRFLGNLSYLKMQSLNYNEAIFNSAEITHARTQKDLKQKDISIEKLGIFIFCKYLIISFAEYFVMINAISYIDSVRILIIDKLFPKIESTLESKTT